jgi:hypothetical protein
VLSAGLESFPFDLVVPLLPTILLVTCRFTRMRSGAGELVGGAASWRSREISAATPSGSRSLASGLNLNLVAVAAARWRKTKG